LDTVYISQHFCHLAVLFTIFYIYVYMTIFCPKIGIAATNTALHTNRFNTGVYEKVYLIWGSFCEIYCHPSFKLCQLEAVSLMKKIKIK